MLCLWDVRCKPSLLFSGICIYEIVLDMLADASHPIECGSFPTAECLAITYSFTALCCSSLAVASRDNYSGYMREHLRIMQGITELALFEAFIRAFNVLRGS